MLSSGFMWLLHSFCCIKWQISNPVTMQVVSAGETCVDPTAPFPFSIALFTSCSWSIPMAEKSLLHFIITNTPKENARCMSSVFISPCEGSFLLISKQRAQWYYDSVQLCCSIILFNDRMIKQKARYYYFRQSLFID